MIKDLIKIEVPAEDYLDDEDEEVEVYLDEEEQKHYADDHEQ